MPIKSEGVTDSCSEPKIDPTQSTDLIHLFARVLLSGVTHLLKKGFDRGYIVHSEETKVLRGRIQFQPTLKRGLLFRAHAHCEFDELSYDVLHNRILKTTLSRLIRADGIDISNREQLVEHWHNMPEVGTVDLSSQVFGKVQLYRNNHLYDFLLKVCELLHVNLLPTEKPGAWRFRSFLQDPRQMAALFEQFVRNFYKREAWRVFMSGTLRWVARTLVGNSPPISWSLRGYCQKWNGLEALEDHVHRIGIARHFLFITAGERLGLHSR